MEEELDEVISILKGVILPVKGGLAFARLTRDYYEMEGTQIPFKKFGFSTLLDFINSIPQIKVGRDPAQLLTIHDPQLGHLTKMVSAQKSNKKRPRVNVRRFGSGMPMMNRNSSRPFQAPRFGQASGGYGSAQAPRVNHSSVGGAYGFPPRKPVATRPVINRPIINRPVANRPTQVYAGGSFGVASQDETKPPFVYKSEQPQEWGSGNPKKEASAGVFVKPTPEYNKQVPKTSAGLMPKTSIQMPINRKALPTIEYRNGVAIEVEPPFKQVPNSEVASYLMPAPKPVIAPEIRPHTEMKTTSQCKSSSTEESLPSKLGNKPGNRVSQAAHDRLEKYRSSFDKSSTNVEILTERMKTSLNIAKPDTPASVPEPGRWGLAVDDRRPAHRKPHVPEAKQHSSARSEHVTFYPGAGDSRNELVLTKTVTQVCDERVPTSEVGAGDLDDSERFRYRPAGVVRSSSDASGAARVAAERMTSASNSVASTACAPPAPVEAYTNYYAKHYSWFAGTPASNLRDQYAQPQPVSSDYLTDRQPAVQAVPANGHPVNRRSRGRSTTNLSSRLLQNYPPVQLEALETRRSPIERSVVLREDLQLTVSVSNTIDDQLPSPDIGLVYEQPPREQPPTQDQPPAQTAKNTEWELESFKLLLRPKYVDSVLIGDNFFLKLAQKKLKAKCLFVDDVVFRCGLCVSGLTLHDSALELVMEKVMTNQVVVMLGAIDLLMDKDVYDVRNSMVRLMEVFIDKFHVERVVVCTIPLLHTATAAQQEQQKKFNTWIRHWCSGSKVFDCCDLFEVFMRIEGIADRSLHETESIGVELGDKKSKIVNILLWNEKGYEVVLAELSKHLKSLPPARPKDITEQHKN